MPKINIADLDEFVEEEVNYEKSSYFFSFGICYFNKPWMFKKK